MKKCKINKSVSLMLVELLTKTCLISNKRNRMLLTLVSPVRGDLYLGYIRFAMQFWYYYSVRGINH